MMVYSTTIFALPCVLAVWAIDSYLFIAFVRSVCGRLVPAESSRSWYRNLIALTDPLPERVGHWLARETKTSAPRLAGWMVVVCGLLIVRSILVRLMLAGS